MKKFITCFSFFWLVTVGYTQPMPDTLKTKYKSIKADGEKGRLLFAYLVRATTADSSAIARAVELHTWFKNQNDKVGADYTELYLASVFLFKGDYSTGLNMVFPILSQFEKRKDNYGLMRSNNVIGLAFSFAKNHEQAFQYFKKAISLAEIMGDRIFLSNVFNDIGVAYSTALMPDSGLIYAQKAVNIDVERNDVDRIPVSVSTLAENYMAAKEYEIAIPFLRKSMAYYLSQKDNRNSFGIAYVNNDFAQAFLAIKQYDSANYYAYRAIEISNLPGFKEQMLRSYEYLYKSFEETKKQDSVTKYFRLAMTTKDSLYSLEKTRSIENMHFHEEMRQQEMQTDRKKTEQVRRQNIQYALIALGIITFIIFFIMLSRRHITSTSLIQFLGVVALLLVFEFLNLLLHPFLERITNHSPVLILLALVCVAGLLVPLHRKLEHWTTHKLVEKNKAIRLASAKKTIEQLEKPNS